MQREFRPRDCLEVAAGQAGQGEPECKSRLTRGLWQSLAWTNRGRVRNGREGSCREEKASENPQSKAAVSVQPRRGRMRCPECRWKVLGGSLLPDRDRDRGASVREMGSATDERDKTT